MKTAPALGFILILVGCASSGGGREKVRDAELWISGEDVQETALEDLYVIVRQLRPRWFSGQNILVFQNRSPMGGLDALRAMDPRGVHGVEWLSPFEAVEELPAVGYRGADGLDGVIVVWTRPPGGQRSPLH